MRWLSVWLLCVAGLANAETARLVPVAEVLECWNTGFLTAEELLVTVEVEFELSEDGQLVAETINLVGVSSEGSVSADRVYDTVRRAIIRCGSRELSGAGPQRIAFRPSEGAWHIEDPFETIET